MMKLLTLYHFQSCPYCARVRHFIEDQGLDIPMKDIRLDPAAQEELKAIGGKTQVPCLVIDGVALYESTDIIAWLKQHQT